MSEHNPETTARLEEIESRFAYQEQMLDELNDIIVRQQGQIDQLEALSRHLLEKLRELDANEDSSGDGNDLLQEKPPHY